MPNKQRERSPLGRNTSVRWALACAVLAIGIAGLYLALYRTKGYTLPVGFDAPWYVWRASFVSSRGLGPLGTSTRPGSAVLAAVLGGVTGRSQLTIAVLLGPMLAGVFALALGGLVWSSLGRGRWRWLGAVVVGGTVLGATRLVDENVATLLFLCVLVSALSVLVAAAAGDGARWAFVGSVLLLVAAGLAHWLFLAVFGLMLVGAVALLGPRALRLRRAEDVKWARTEGGTLASAGLWVAGAMSLTVFGLLRAPANTIQLREDPSRFVPKLTNDVARLRLWLLGPVAAFGAWILARSSPEERHERRRAVLLSLLAAWLVVCVGGIVVGVATKKLPPHRFLELAIVVPGVVAIVEAVGWLGQRVKRGWLVAVAACVVLAVPGVSAWYASGAPKPWMTPEALQQVRTAAAWLGTLKPGPFVIWVSPFGPAGTESPALKERTIRAALPANLQERFHMVAGDFVSWGLGDPFFGLSPAMRAAVRPYWDQAWPLLKGSAAFPILILRSLDPKEFEEFDERGGIGKVLAPGVLALPSESGRVPSRAVTVPDQTNAFQGIMGSAFWTVLLLALLSGAGLGWTRVIAGRRAHPAVAFGLSPAVGAGGLVLVGTLVSRLGVGLGTGASWAVWLAVTAGGAVAARAAAAAGRDRQATLRT
jgi:hypothetical protein